MNSNCFKYSCIKMGNFSSLRPSVVAFYSTSNETDEEDNVNRLRIKVIIETDLAIEW